MYRAADGNWFLIVTETSRWPALAAGIGRPDLVSDPRFGDSEKIAANAAQLTAILDEVFGSQPMAHWHEVFDHAHIPFGVVQTPSEVIKDSQLRENDIVVPLEGAAGNLKNTVNSPFQVHGVDKAPATRAPELGEHNEEVLKQLGFDAKDIDGLRASGAIPKVKEHAAQGSQSTQRPAGYDDSYHRNPRRAAQKSRVQHRSIHRLRGFWKVQK